MSALVFQEERWADYAAEARALWPLHWQELYADRPRTGKPMRILEPWYEAMEQAGLLCIITARQAGALGGYVICSTGPSTHYADELCGYEDTYWLAPALRRGTAGLRLIRFAEGCLARRGVERVYFMSHANRPLDRLFEFMKYRRTHTVYSRLIGA